jgi:prophage regulatory protein
MASKTLTQDIVIRRTGLSRTTIYKNRIEGTFPQAIQLSEGRIGWKEEDIDKWIDDRPVAPINKKREK